MDRRDFYFRQKVTEAELDGAFDDVEAALWNAAADHELVGIVLGMDPAQNGVPNLTINVSGPGVAYDRTGRRIAIPSTQNVDVSVDENAVGTAVAGGGNEKYVSVFVEFDRNLSDPRIDGNSLGLFFAQEEGFRFVVRQGAEAAAGLATPVPLDSGMILVCDILRAEGVTSILDSAIVKSRREDAFRLTGLSLEIVAGTPHDAIAALLQHLVDHVDGSASVHPASAIAYAGGGNWADGTPNPATTVEGQLDKIVTALTSADGSKRILSAAVAGTPLALTETSVHAQISAILAAVNGKLPLAGGTVTGGLQVDGSLQVNSATTFNDEIQAPGVDLVVGTITIFNGGDWIAFSEGGVPGVGVDPDVNRLYGKNIPKVWATVTTDGADGVEISDGFGVSGVSIVGGDVVVTFSNPFSGVNYCPIPFHAGSTTKISVTGRTAGTITFSLRDVAAAGVAINLGTNASSFHFVIFGTQ